MLGTKEAFLSMGISKEVFDFGNSVSEGLKESFEQIDQVAEINQLKVLGAMQKHQVSESCLFGTTGYG